MRFTQPRPSSFDARSVLLFTVLSLGGTAALHAQTAADKKLPPGFGSAPAATQPAIGNPFKQLDSNHGDFLSPEEFHQGA